jgi:2-polyprenyl-3-methyl-5-hydroxy-6-metoxy-1,4-benzoquinol methylase/Tfp pilus assembly protein PilF
MNSASDKFARHLPRQAKRVIKREYDRAIYHFRKLNYSKTKASIKKVLNLDPENPAANTLLARIAFVANDFDTAGNLISNVVLNHPSYLDAQKLLGEIYVKIGFLDKAEHQFRQVLALGEDVEAYKALGDCLKADSRYSEAEQSYRKAVNIRPDFPEAHFCLGLSLMENGQHGAASVSLRNAATLKPENGIFWTTWANCLSRVAFVKNDEFLFEDLLALLKQSTVSPGPFVRSIISALYFSTEFTGVLEAYKLGKLKTPLDFITAANSLSLIPLLLKTMVLSPITVPEIEDMFQVLRRGLLSNAAQKIDCLSSLGFLAALAQLCFSNEYLFEETLEETTDLKTLKKNITTILESKEKIPQDWILIIAAYRPLHMVPWAQNLLEQKWLDPVNEVINQQVIEPFKEKSLRTLIPALTSINDSVSHAVLRQYEENPYPSWERVDLSDRARPIGEILGSHNIFLQDANNELIKSPKVLIAGCGTGKQSLNAASKYLDAQIVALDLSRVSLAYAMRKSEELGYESIEYFQGDILELAELEQNFNIIECTGVLHHMKNPLAGWKVLKKILYPGGLMRIALYSEIGRKSIKKARAYISEKGFGNSADDIRRCRKKIIQMAQKDSNMKYIIDTVDFYSLSGCKDMIFHTKEHRFSLLEIKEALNSLDLSFLGFELPATDIAQRFKKIFPEKHAMRSLDSWHEFELKSPETFKGMYLFWVQKNSTDQ